jgi:ribokinase
VTAAIALPPGAPFRRLVGVGGIGSGMFLAVDGDRTVGRTESRSARLLDARDYCKLHTVTHHVATLLGARPEGEPFHVVPVGVVGADDAGARTVTEMRAAGMDVAHVRTVADRPTLFSVCFQYPNGDGGNLTTTATSAASALSATDVDAVDTLLDRRTIALAQPEVPLEARRRFLDAAGAAGAFRAASFTSSELEDARSAGLFDLVDLVALNADEASAVADGALDPADPGAFLRRVADAFGDGTAVIVTAGASGAFAFADGRWIHRGAPAVEVASTAGCGDALLAGVLVALAADLPLIGSEQTADDALSLGVALGSLNATSPHTVHPAATAEAVGRLAAGGGMAFGGALARIVGAIEVTT